MSKAAQRIFKEFEDLTKNPQDGFKVSSENPAEQWDVLMMGPPDTAFENGKFSITMKFDNYPFKPPKVLINTKIYHPNVDENGEICTDVYENDWKPTKKVRMILEVLMTMLRAPNPGSALREEIGAQFREDPKAFEATAREWVTKHAN
jgi:ubiquitin-conjugating enzyme E2 D/E